MGVGGRVGGWVRHSGGGSTANVDRPGGKGNVVVGLQGGQLHVGQRAALQLDSRQGRGGFVQIRIAIL